MLDLLLAKVKSTFTDTVPGSATLSCATVAAVTAIAGGLGQYLSEQPYAVAIGAVIGLLGVVAAGGLPSEFLQLSVRRTRLGLGAAGAATDTSTLALLKINGQQFEGINSADQNPRTAITLRANAQTKTHAEAECVQKAINGGMVGTSTTAEMWIDRPPCDACGKYNGLGSLARELGVTKLTIHYLQNGAIVTEDRFPVLP